MHQHLVVPQRLVQVLVVCGEIEVHEPVGILLVVQVLAFGEERLVVVEVPQVAVELHPVAQGDAHDDQDRQSREDPAVPVPGKVVDPVDNVETLVFLELHLLRLHEVRQEHEGEEGISQEGEGGEEPEVPEQVALREEQAQEGTHRGDAPQGDGRGFLQEHLFHVTHVVVVDEHVQAVTDGDAQDDGAEAQGHQGHVPLDPVHAGQGEDGPVDDGHDLLPDEGPTVETQEQDDEDDEEGNAHGHHQVSADGAGVGNAPEGRSVHEDADFRMGGLEGLPLLGQKVVEPLRSPGVQRGETRGQEGQRHGLVGAEEMPVFDGVTPGGTAFLTEEVAEHEVSQSQRVHRHQLRILAGHVLFQQPQVLLHLREDGVRFQRCLECRVQGRVDEGRQVLEPVVHRPEHRAHVDGMQDSGDEPPGRVPLQEGIGESGDTFAEDRRVHGVRRICRSDLDEYLVLESYITECQFIVSA